jgi:hypothetical protein
MVGLIAVAALCSLTTSNGIVQVKQLETTTINPAETNTVTLTSIVESTIPTSIQTTETTTVTQSLLPQGTTPGLAILFAAAFLGSLILLLRTRRGVMRKDYCVRCGARLSRGEDYCTKCGAKRQRSQSETTNAPQPTTQKAPEHRRQVKAPSTARGWFCSKCGSENLPEERFCGNCGTPK